MDSLKMSLNLNKCNYNVLKLNQYDKGVPIEINLIQSDGAPYILANTDIVKVEWALPNGVGFIDTDIAKSTSSISFNIKREVTLNSGKGTFNIAIENANFRKATFACEVVIMGNSIDENTVPEPILLTLFEEVNAAITACDSRVQEINKAVANADLASYAKTTDVNNALDKKVDKELKTGSTTAYKVLSDNNYSDTDKNIVDNVTANLANKMNSTKGTSDDKFDDLYFGSIDITDSTNWSIPLGNGIIKKGGYITGVNSTSWVRVDYKTAFPNKCLSVQLTELNAVDGSHPFLNDVGLNAAHYFQVKCGSGSRKYYWEAIGY